MNSFFQGPYSWCQSSIFSLFCLSLLLFFLCPHFTFWNFFGKNCKFMFLPLGSEINCTIPIWRKPKIWGGLTLTLLSVSGGLSSQPLSPNKNKAETPKEKQYPFDHGENSWLLVVLTLCRALFFTLYIRPLATLTISSEAQGCCGELGQCHS